MLARCPVSMCSCIHMLNNNSIVIDRIAGKILLRPIYHRVRHLPVRRLIFVFTCIASSLRFALGVFLSLLECFSFICSLLSAWSTLSSNSVLSFFYWPVTHPFSSVSINLFVSKSNIITAFGSPFAIISSGASPFQTSWCKN